MIDWVRNLLAPSASAAASRLVVPWLRSRLVRAMPRWRSGGLWRAVSSWMTASADSRSTARSRPSRSRASASTGRAVGPGPVPGEAEHLVVVGEQLAGDRDPDGAAGPGEQDLHDSLLRVGSAGEAQVGVGSTPTARRSCARPASRTTGAS